jgi:hypothetical protein
LTPSVPIPPELLDSLREEAARRGLWLHDAVEEALRQWLSIERRRRRGRMKLHPRREQLTAIDIRQLVRLNLTRSEASELVAFTEWLRETGRADVLFWRGKYRKLTP